MIHAGAGKYYVNTLYSANGAAGIFVINLNTRQPISNLQLDSSKDSSEFDFNLDQTTPIVIAVILAPETSGFTLKHLTFGKYLPNN
jgi:hypothetical protein